MRLIGIDPGPKTSGLVIWDTDTQRCERADKAADNAELLRAFRASPQARHVVIEGVTPRGNLFGWDVLHTHEWQWRFVEANARWLMNPVDAEVVTRDDVRLQLFGKRHVKNTNSAILNYLLNYVGPKGTKKAPGRTFGCSSHAWSALGVLVAWDQLKHPDPDSLYIKEWNGR